MGIQQYCIVFSMLNFTPEHWYNKIGVLENMLEYQMFTRIKIYKCFISYWRWHFHFNILQAYILCKLLSCDRPNPLQISQTSISPSRDIGSQSLLLANLQCLWCHWQMCKLANSQCAAVSHHSKASVLNSCSSDKVEVISCHHSRYADFPGRVAQQWWCTKSYAESSMLDIAFSWHFAIYRTSYQNAVWRGIPIFGLLLFFGRTPCVRLSKQQQRDSSICFVFTGWWFIPRWWLWACASMLGCICMYTCIHTHAHTYAMTHKKEDWEREMNDKSSMFSKARKVLYLSFLLFHLFLANLCSS